LVYGEARALLFAQLVLQLASGSIIKREAVENANAVGGDTRRRRIGVISLLAVYLPPVAGIRSLRI
jgi:hypothetical protein